MGGIIHWARKNSGQWMVYMITFEYKYNVHNQYQHIESVKLHNSRRKAPIAMEEKSSTRLWGNHIFPVLLSLLEVNNNLGEKHFGVVETVRQMLEFRILPNRDLIYKPYLIQDDLTS